MGGIISRSRVMKLLVVLAVILPALGVRAPAAEKTLSWWRDACGYSVSFDPEAYDEARLRNTVHLIYGPPDFKAPAVGLPFNPQSVARLNLEHIGRECRGVLDVARRLEFVPLAGIEDYRRALMDDIADTCAFETVQIRGFRDPSALRDYPPAAACSPYVDALEGKRDLMAAFRQTVGERCGGTDQACVDRELARAQKDDGTAWARLYLLKYGWNRCASDFTSRGADGQKREAMRTALEAQFRRVFTVTANGCEADASSQPAVRAVSTTAIDPAPAREASPAAKLHRVRCRNPTATARGLRPDPERALCAAAHTSRRSASAELPTPYAAARSKQPFARAGR